MKYSRRIFITLFCLAAIRLVAGTTEKMSFEKTTVAKLAAGNVHMTRAEVPGYVTYVSNEADGDIHIRLCDSPKVAGPDAKHCVICEIMPCDQAKVRKPKVGEQITVQGITRFDGEHKWWELHPATGIK